eukprot:m.171091 g.171091  ORF g.171091 m.171091 type:complete len:142 (+) comp31632_c1_seq1:334-759(+)
MMGDRLPRTILVHVFIILISLVGVLTIETTTKTASTTSKPFAFQSFENAIPNSLLKKLLQDEQVQSQLSQKQALHNKLGTIWLPLTGEKAVLKPRFATEETIFHFKSLAETFDVGFESKNIIGAEWWYQNRGIDWIPLRQG